jgi:citrate lyase subunit beta/citryl-CoA lyase
MSEFRPLIAPLFVPATRPDRIAKAAQSGADAIIVDLEDAVPALQKGPARNGLADFLNDLAVPVFVRVNAVDTEWFSDDMAFVRNTHVAGVMLAKTQSADDIAAVGADIVVIGLIESALGVTSLSDICRAANLHQLAFGSIDYALDVGCLETREALLLARLSIATQSRAHGLAAPLDGVTVSITDQAMVQSDTEYAVGLGFGGKLVIHPKQIDIVMAAMHPSADDLDWARSVCAADKASGGAAVVLDGRMIDAPVIKKARQILRRAGTR